MSRVAYTISQILPQSGQPDKGKALSHFHALSLHHLPDLWKTIASELEVVPLNPMEMQAVNRHLFNLYLVQQCGQHNSTPTSTRISLLAEEDNAIRYVSGYIASKLLKKYKKVQGEAAAQFVECLGGMGSVGNDSSFLKYTAEWLESIDRGGLFHCSDGAFQSPAEND